MKTQKIREPWPKTLRLEDGIVPTSTIQEKEFNLLCHVSPFEIKDKIEPRDCGDGTPLIYFSENEFMSYYGEYIYIFDKKLLEDKYRIRYKGEALHMKQEFDLASNERVTYREQEKYSEYICREPIYIFDAIGIIKHRNLSKDNFVERRHKI